jgi:hypothetical protein
MTINDFHAIGKASRPAVHSFSIHKSHPDLDYHSDTRFTNQTVSGSHPDPKIGLYHNKGGKRPPGLGNSRSPGLGTTVGQLGLAGKQVNWLLLAYYYLKWL